MKAAENVISAGCAHRISLVCFFFPVSLCHFFLFVPFAHHASLVHLFFLRTHCDVRLKMNVCVGGCVGFVGFGDTANSATTLASALIGR